VPSEAEGQLNQLKSGITDTSVATLGKSITCISSGLLSLSSLIGGLIRVLDKTTTKERQEMLPLPGGG